MKGIIYLIVFFCFFILSCGYEEGPVGPQGPTGDQGPIGEMGPKGPPGEDFKGDSIGGSVFYSEWKSYPAGLSVKKGNRDYIMDIEVPQLTELNIDHVLVLVFFHDKFDSEAAENSEVHALPYTNNNVLGGNWVYNTYTVGKIRIHATYDPAVPNRGFRYIIIPESSEFGNALARRSDPNAESDEDLYFSVCRKYNIAK